MNRSNLFLAALCCVLVGVLIFRELNPPANHREKLVMGAFAVDAILPRGYHDRIEDENSISPEEYESLRDTLNEFSWRSGIEYAYAYVISDGKVRMTASSFPKDEMEQGLDQPFFDEYEDAPEIYFEVAKREPGVPVFDEYDDPELGEYFTALIPLVTPEGKVYVVGADYCPPSK